MQLIKKIIGWLISLFRMIFKKEDRKANKLSSKNINRVTNKNKIKAVTSVIDETLPSYMFLSKREKDLLINSIRETKKKIENDSNDYLNNEINDFIKILDEYVKEDNFELKEIVTSLKNDLHKGINKNTNKQLDLLSNYLPNNKKEEISIKYNILCNDKLTIKENISKVDNIINSLEKKNISLIEKNNIEETNDTFINSKSDSIIEDVTNYNKDVLYIMENINKNIIDKVKLEYKKINYITLSTELIDEIQDKLQKVEDNYKNHRYNKYYYDREIKKIKRQILELKELKNKPYVYNEILKLRKELYTKSKDKYDILYNNEIYMDINQKCDDLINKVNAKVVDIKKEKKEKDKQKKNNEYIKNILLRFQDMKLAREIIMNKNLEDFKNESEMLFYIKNMYDEFSSNTIDKSFNFDRNRDKTELVVFFNKLSKVNSYLKKEQFIPIEHINFRMNDLLEAVDYKKEELNTIMSKKYNVDIGNENVDNTINNLMKKENINKPKTLVKKEEKSIK